LGVSSRWCRPTAPPSAIIHPPIMPDQRGCTHTTCYISRYSSGA
jgi:hypothetical protein